jgi:phosphoglycolate phosphatase-like HAD superfamily hydrolase
MEQSLTDLDHVIVHPSRPLVIVDVDEVLAKFMAGFERFVGRHGYEMRVEKFALFQNIYPLGQSDHVAIERGVELFNSFFEHGADDLEPAEGAADALADLSSRAEVVVLTNAPGHGRAARSGWLRKHGFDYPLVINAGLKGPAAAELARRTVGASAFIDDLLPNLESVAEAAPAIARFQMVADERLRPLAPSLPERHARHDEWPALKTAIEAAILR